MEELNPEAECANLERFREPLNSVIPDEQRHSGLDPESGRATHRFELSPV